MVQGTKAFCSGGDQALRTSDGYADPQSFGRLNVLDLQVNFLYCCYKEYLIDYFCSGEVLSPLVFCAGANSPSS